MKKLLIEIPEEDYHRIASGFGQEEDAVLLEKIFKNGIPLPEPCEDVVSRKDVEECKELMTDINGETVYAVRMSDIRKLSPVTLKQKLCKDCKFFEYDSVAKVDGIPLIVAHEICNKWGDGCKTKEDGYCFLFEPKLEGESK